MDTQKLLPVFTRRSKIAGLIAMALLVIGNILLWQKPAENMTNDPEIFNFIIMNVAPILLIGGFVLVIYAILQRK